MSRPVSVLTLGCLALASALGALSCSSSVSSSVGSSPAASPSSSSPRAEGPPARARIFEDPRRPDADKVARAVGTLIAGGDSGIVASYLKEVRAETDCGSTLLVASVARGPGEWARLARHRAKVIDRLRADASITNIGNALVPISIPYKIVSSSLDGVVDAAWVAVVVGLSCPKGTSPPTGRADGPIGSRG